MHRSSVRRPWTPTRTLVLAVFGLLFLALAAPAAAQRREPQPPSQPAPCQGSGSIAGTVRDAAGAPVAGADVMAYGEREEPLLGRSDADGSYRLEQACAGDHVVLAYLDDAQPLVGFYDVGADGEPDIVTLAADDTAVGGIDIVLSEMEVVIGPDPLPAACASPEGRVSGRLLDAAGQGIGGAEVQIYGQNAFVSTVSEADGSYTAAGLCAGSYLAFAWDQDPTQPRMGFYDGNGDLEPDELSLAADDTAVSGIDIVLHPAEEAAPLPEPKVCEQPAFAAEGRVTGLDGQALEGATVLAFAEDGSYAEGQSAADGTYRLELCAGSYVAVAYKDLAPNKIQVGFHDPNSDGQPDRFQVDADKPLASAIDIQMSMEDSPAPQAAGAPRADRVDGLRRWASLLGARPDWLRRLAPDRLQPRQPIRGEPRRPSVD